MHKEESLCCKLERSRHYSNKVVLWWVKYSQSSTQSLILGKEWSYCLSGTHLVIDIGVSVSSRALMLYHRGAVMTSTWPRRWPCVRITEHGSLKLCDIWCITRWFKITNVEPWLATYSLSLPLLASYFTHLSLSFPELYPDHFWWGPPVNRLLCNRKRDLRWTIGKTHGRCSTSSSSSSSVSSPQSLCFLLVPGSTLYMLCGHDDFPHHSHPTVTCCCFHGHLPDHCCACGDQGTKAHLDHCAFVGAPWVSMGVWAPITFKYILTMKCKVGFWFHPFF